MTGTLRYNIDPLNLYSDMQITDLLNELGFSNITNFIDLDQKVSIYYKLNKFFTFFLDYRIRQ